MIKRWLLFLFLVVEMVALKAQQNTNIPLSNTDPMECYIQALEFLSDRQYAKAREILQQGLVHAKGEIREKCIQKIGMSWYFEGCVLKLQSKIEAAYPCFEEARKYYRQAGAKKDEISVLMQMAEVQKRVFAPEHAMEKYEQAAVLASEVSDTLKWVNALRGKGRILKDLGQWNDYVRLSLKLDSLVLNAKDVMVQVEVNQEKGDNALYLWGNYPMAEMFYKKNVELISQLPESYQISEAFIANLRLCDLMIEQKRYKEALEYNRQCLALHSVSSKDSVDIANSYTPYINRAFIYKEMVMRDSCYRCMDSLFRSHRIVNITPRIKAMHYIQRGMNYAHFKDYELAISDYKYADTLLANSYADSDRSRMNILAAIGGCLYHRKEYALSETYYIRYANLCRSKFGEESVEYANALYYLANIEGFNKEWQNGCRDLGRAAALLQTIIKKQLRYLPSNARTKYWDDLSDIMWSMTAYAVKIGAAQEKFTLDAYNALVFSRGLLLESEKSLEDLIHRIGTEEDVVQYNKMIFLQSQLGKKVVKSDSIGSVYSQIDRIDKWLAHKYAFYEDYTRFLDVQYEDIRAVLKDKEVIVDFMDYKVDSIHYYGAYIFRKEWKYPLLLSLFTQEQMDTLYGSVNQADQLYQNPQSNAFLKLCWEPLTKYIQLGDKVYYVPSGDLHQVSLESLPLTSDSLLGDKYRFIRVSSSREVGKERKYLQTGKKSAALYGGLYYDVDLSVMNEESKKYDISRLFALRSGATGADSVYHYLPMTKEEVTSIATILVEHQIDTLLFVGAAGTEESFFNLDKHSPQIIHLATHGFYYISEHNEPTNGTTVYQDAMRFSGLVMSGGNAARRKMKLPESILDGVLTADDISRIDLSGTELVVLSACDTGLGRVNSEGVFGLQRAFKKAGVQTLVMSLWKISDRVTKEFMLHFYSNSAEYKWDKRKAFDSAKTIIRQSYPEPFYWAGFIMLD